MTLQFKDLRNASTKKFHNLTSERCRTYIWPDGGELHIMYPVALAVSDSGGHRVLDDSGICYYIPAGWRTITWCVKDGCPHFDF